jgi:hypothetical protein
LHQVKFGILWCLFQIRIWTSELLPGYDLTARFGPQALGSGSACTTKEKQNAPCY